MQEREPGGRHTGVQRRVLEAPLDDVLVDLLAEATGLTASDGAWFADRAGRSRLIHGTIEPAVHTATAEVVTANARVGGLAAVRTTPRPFDPPAARQLELIAELAAAAVLASEAAARDDLAALRAETLARMHSSAGQLRALFASTPLGVALVRGGDLALLRTNDALAELTATPARTLATMTALELAPVAEREEFRAWLRDPPLQNQSRSREMRLITGVGEPIWARVFAAAVAGAVPEQLVLQAEDITAQRQAQQLLSRLAHTDPLTGLANRHEVLRQLESSLSRARDDDVCVLYLDLDDFKSVNDTEGHAAGDELLRQVAHRLTSAVRPRDVVGRLGGDEFVVVLDHVIDLSELNQMTKRIRERIGDDVQLDDGRHVHVGASIGLSTAQPGDSPTSLLDRADRQMYAEKSSHRPAEREGLSSRRYGPT